MRREFPGAAYFATAVICTIISPWNTSTNAPAGYGHAIRESIVASELPLTSDNIYSEIQKDLIRPIFVSSMMAIRWIN